METVTLDQVTVGPSKSAKKGAWHEVHLTLTVRDPEQVGDELDDAGGEIARFRFTHPETGILLVEFLGHIESCELKTPKTEDPHLVLKVKSMRKHASPAALRRLGNHQVKVWISLLDAQMRQQALREATVGASTHLAQ